MCWNDKKNQPKPLLFRSNLSSEQWLSRASEARSMAIKVKGELMRSYSGKWEARGYLKKSNKSFKSTEL